MSFLPQMNTEDTDDFLDVLSVFFVFICGYK